MCGSWILVQKVHTRPLSSERSAWQGSLPPVAAVTLVGTARLHNGKRDSTTYVYHATSGRLASLTAHWGAPLNQARTIQFTFDALGRRRELAYPNQVTVKFRYGAEGSLRRAVAVNANPSAPPDDDNFTFTRRLLAVDAVGQAHGEHLLCGGTGPASDNVASLCGSGNHSGVLERDLDRLGHLVYQPSPDGSAEWYRYDRAGNLVWRKRNSEQHHYRIANLSNRLAADSIGGQAASQVTYYWYTADGALFEEKTGAGTVLRRLYYDGLGRAVGLRDVGGDNGNGPGRYRCSYYGPSAWLVAPCPSGTESPPWLVYDGANVGATLGERWVFVQGGGVDDPVMGLYRSSSQPGVATEYYWITDGAGRHLAAGSANGTLGAGSPPGMQYLNLGGKFVGTTQAATSYDAERQTTTSAPTLSMFRHRVYDQRTGRWAQEDPLGIAGGLNLYQFNGSNPSTYSDPFGLCPECKKAREAVEGPIYDSDPGLADPVMALATVLTGGGALGARGVAAGIGESGAGKVVVGETMTRVRAAAAKLGAEAFETTASTAKEIWKANSSWLRKAMREGKEIIDLGEDAARAIRSKFYEAEKALIERRGYPTTKVTE